MRMGPTVSAALVGVLLVALIAGSGGAAAAESRSVAAGIGPDLESCADDSPEDFGAPASGDAMGYVDGYWYDEPLVLGPTDGANDSSGANDSNGANDSSGPNGSDEANESTRAGAGTGSQNGTTVNGTDANATFDGEVNATDSGGANETAPGNESVDGGNESDGGNEMDGGNESEAPADDADTATPDDGQRVDATDGLDDRELDAVVARTAARVEVMRCLSFHSVPTVRVENRSTVRANQRAAIAERSATTRRFDDALLETSLILGGAVNASDARAATTASATLGFYDPATGEIVVVAENGTASDLDEATLAHELVHALQDQHFDLDRFDASRTDAAFAESALIEGDASLVGHRYRTRCADGDWALGCLESSSGSTGNSEYLGLELFYFQPYNEGPAYAEALYAQGGWPAVNDRYDTPPASTKELLYPTTSTAFEPATVSFQPVTDPAWERLEPSGQPAHDVLGPGTIGAAVLAPTFQADMTNIYSAQHVTNNVDQSTLDPLEPYDYAVDATAGWEGGRFEVYGTEDGQTATRWRTTWESETAAASFRERYVQLLEVRGAASSRNFVGTYHFPPDNEFDGRYAIRQNGTTVTIVHGPNLDAIRALDHQAAREPREGSSSSMTGISASKQVAEDALSGPGALGAAVGILIALGLIGIVAARRR